MDGVENWGDYFWTVIEAAKRGDYDAPVMNGFIQDYTQCPVCAGRGDKDYVSCSRCNGRGWVRKEKL